MDSVFGPIFDGIAWLLSVFYSVVPDLGIAIVLLTMVIMVLLYPLTAKQAKSMIAMQSRRTNAGFAVDTNHVYLVDRDGVTDVPPGPKAEVAHRILDRIARLRPSDPAQC